MYVYTHIYIHTRTYMHTLPPSYTLYGPSGTLTGWEAWVSRAELGLGISGLRLCGEQKGLRLRGLLAFGGGPV